MPTAAATRKAEARQGSVRVDSATDRSIDELAKETGQTKAAIVRDAVRDFRRKTFFDGLKSDFEALRQDPDAWAEVCRERAEWDATIADGLDRE